MTDFVRVRDETTGHEYSAARVLKHHKVIDKPAVDRNGDPLPAKTNPHQAKKATEAKEATA